MTPARWEHIKQLYHAARSRADGERDGFLASACASDCDLRREVQALLDQPVSTGGFVHFLGGSAPTPRVDRTDADLSGRRLGTYQVLSLLGKGGMGEVYRAHDTTLGRDVAMKVLPAEFIADPERLAWFANEARMLAALNHPHIGAIYGLERGLEDVDGMPALVLELVEGETLAERLRRAPFSVREALGVVRQIVDALDAAHQKGVIHRDLKPANVKITPDGVVKVLDFGLAKAAASEAVPSSQSPEAPAAPTGASRVGMILGTAAYMSPEQVRGLPVDARADIWSFGCVLYEMLTGRSPFAGETVAETFAAILEREPDWASLPTTLPSSLRELLEGCLQKEVTRRVQNISEARATIERGQQGRNLWRVAAIAAAPVLAALLLLVVSGVWLWTRGSGERWARNTALPEIVRLFDRDDRYAAGRLMRQVDKLLPGDPQVERLVRTHLIGGRVSYATTPSGADIYIKPYAAPNDAWEWLGTSPLTGVAVAGFNRFRVVKPGYEEVETTTFGWPVTLPAKDIVPPGMVLVPDGSVEIEDTRVTLSQYWLDRYEVTNAQYKTFVDHGAYRKKEYWTHPFVKDGKVISWDIATAMFRDATGRLGPSTWEFGTYPEGSADHPVGGLSWYEAAAYAEFVGKSLPTVYHWRRAAGYDDWGAIVEHSNYTNQGSVKVGTYRNEALFGVYDVAGNVREWCLNAVGEKRSALGGKWNDPEYSFQKLVSQPPFDRDAGNGIRLAKYISAPPAEATAGLAAEEKPRDLSVERPVPDEVFRAYEGLYSYDRTELNATIESVEEREEYRKERISFDAAYGDERMSAYLLLPRNASPPYQTVVYFPTLNAWQTRSDELEMMWTAFWLRGGRAVLYPIYKGAHDRFAPLPEDGTSAQRDLTVQWAKDLGRSIDYLETRHDIDRARLAYSGASYGAIFGPVMVQAAGRFKAAVWLFGGLLDRPLLPESEPLNFLPRVKIPVLMINGRNDYLCAPLESQEPMFRTLGTPDEHKRHLVMEGGHVPTRRSEVYRHAVDWLDKYLGPVRR